MTAPMITTENLGKRYRVKRPNTAGGTGLRHALEAGARNLWNGLGRMAKGQAPFDPIPPEEEFWALKDVSFEVQQGECVGIIGRNGAGKSTLLKILSRITEPSAGRAILRGRVGSLLEVGTGFHSELTGRENIFLNGSILGMRRHEILRRLDEIIAFAEVDQFLDTPVKYYSSGMHMRLAFAVAAHLDPEILIVDEVLAVGDAQFQKKCMGKMSEVAKEGRTVLFVSHNMGAVKELCTRGVVITGGCVHFNDTASKAVDFYMESLELSQEPPTGSGRRIGSGEWRFINAEVSKPIFKVGEPIECQFIAESRSKTPGPVYLSGLLIDHRAVNISQFDSRLNGIWVNGKQPISGTLKFQGLWLKPGNYAIDMYICGSSGIIDIFQSAVKFNIQSTLPYPYAASPDAIASALVLTEFNWDIKN